MPWFRLCHVDDIPMPGSMSIRRVSDRRDYGFVVRNTRGVFAWRNACPHLGYEGTSMAWKKNQYLTGDKQYIMCAAHGARFEIDSGISVSGPCPGKKLVQIQIKIDESNVIHWLASEELAS